MKALLAIISQDAEDETVLYLYDKTRHWYCLSQSSLPPPLQHLFNATQKSKQKVCLLKTYFLLCMLVT